MDLASFKVSLGLLFFGAAIAFAPWQLAELRKLTGGSQRRLQRDLKRASSEDVDGKTTGEREESGVKVHRQGSRPTLQRAGRSRLETKPV